MSFPIVLQCNTSPVNKVGKSIRDIATATGTLRSGTSILDPIVRIESALSENLISEVNYAHIAVFNRYYLVTNIEIDNNSLWNIHMHVDVLETYKDEIKAQDAVVARQEEKYNLMLDDGWFMTYQNPIVQTLRFSVANPFPESNKSYILVLAGS